mgnify:CR=1 FL=1
MFDSTLPSIDYPVPRRVGSVDEAVPADVGTRWYVLHTKSRQEKAVAKHLARRQANFFLPLVSQVRFYGRRKVSVDLPMFPGYVFLFGAREQAFEADRTKRLARIIEVADQQQIEWEIKNLQLAIEKAVPLDPYPYLRMGTRAEVRSGPFRGLQGVIEQRPRPDRLMLQVDMLGRAVSVEIDGSLLEPIE